MSNVLSEEKKQQVIALGKLGWPLRRIEQATGVRRETAGAYLKAAGIVVRPPGAWGRRAPAKPANGVTTDLAVPFSGNQGPPSEDCHPSASACAPYRKPIEQGLGRGRNAMAIWQDLVSDHGFAGGYQTVKRFVHKLRGPTQPQAVGIILTAAGEEAQVDYHRTRSLTTNRPPGTTPFASRLAPLCCGQETRQRRKAYCANVSAKIHATRALFLV